MVASQIHAVNTSELLSLSERRIANDGIRGSLLDRKQSPSASQQWKAPHGFGVGKCECGCFLHKFASRITWVHGAGRAQHVERVTDGENSRVVIRTLGDEMGSVVFPQAHCPTSPKNTIFSRF